MVLFKLSHNHWLTYKLYTITGLHTIIHNHWFTNKHYRKLQHTTGSEGLQSCVFCKWGSGDKQQLMPSNLQDQLSIRLATGWDGNYWSQQEAKWQIIYQNVIMAQAFFFFFLNQAQLLCISNSILNSTEVNNFHFGLSRRIDYDIWAKLWRSTEAAWQHVGHLKLHIIE